MVHDPVEQGDISQFNFHPQSRRKWYRNVNFIILYYIVQLDLRYCNSLEHKLQYN